MSIKLYRTQQKEVVRVFLAKLHEGYYIEASDFLDFNMHWASTPHGDKYWRDIRSQIAEYVHEGKELDILKIKKKCLKAYAGYPLEIEKGTPTFTRVIGQPEFSVLYNGRK